MNTNERRRETMATIRFFAIFALILTVSVTAVIAIIKTHSIKEMREDGRIVTITSYHKEEPHRETISMWDYDNNKTNEHYTNIEYYEYSGTYVVEVSTYDGEHIGIFEIKPEYYGEDFIEEGLEIEMYKLQPIKRDIEKVAKETVPNKEFLQEIKPVEKQEVEQSLVSIETRTQTLVPIKNK